MLPVGSMAKIAEPMPDVERSALLIVDVQNDFCAGGALAVPGSGQVVTALNRYLEEAVASGIPVYASRDWHPPVTSHFRPFGGDWPVHCVRETPGAQFHPELHLPEDVIIVTKGQQENSHGYSAFEGLIEDGRPLSEHLRRNGITNLYVGGLATDYCVRHSVLDALAADFKVTLLQDAIAGVDVAPGDSGRALEEMRRHGVRLSGPGGGPQPPAPQKPAGD